MKVTMAGSIKITGQYSAGIPARSSLVPPMYKNPMNGMIAAANVTKATLATYCKPNKDISAHLVSVMGKRGV